MDEQKLQQLAEELASLDREKDAERMITIESIIFSYETKMLSNINGKAYFPLLKEYNGFIPYDDYYDILIDVLYIKKKLLRKYDPKKARFTSALRFHLQNCLKDYIKKSKEKSLKEVSLDSRREELGEAGEPVDLSEFTDTIIKKNDTEMQVLLEFLPIVVKRKKMDEHCVKKMWFERFYTFNVTKYSKNDYICAEEAVQANAALWPVMEKILLEYLMYGEFHNMCDVIDHKLKDETLLNKCNEVIQKCYNISKPTVCERYDHYKKALKTTLSAYR